MKAATLGVNLVLLVLAPVVAAGPAAAAADSPTVEPAPPGVPLIFGYFADLDGIGYEAAEYFISGDAHAYTAVQPLPITGQWNTSALPTTAAYKTRVLAHWPTDPSRFNGTVYVEWLNVSGGVDSPPDWVHGHTEVARQGAAYVVVSAQFVGEQQLKGDGDPSDPPGDPARYGTLVHPGDSYSYDIFSQAGQAIWDADLLDGLVPERLVAAGESQSAGRMATYINGVHPLVEVYDGFLVHSRGPGGAPLSQPPLDLIEVSFTWIRGDIDAVTIGFQAEGDPGFECALPINSGPMHWLINASLNWLDRWVRTGTPPPIAPRLEALSAPGQFPVVFDVDEHGNVLGGIRTPYVDVPIARLNGVGNGPAQVPPPDPNSFFCFIFGVTDPFSDEKLAELYPNHGSFVSQYAHANESAVESGFLLQEDADALQAAAARSDIGK